jgi:hypothetical protein
LLTAPQSRTLSRDGLTAGLPLARYSFGTNAIATAEAIGVIASATTRSPARTPSSPVAGLTI